MLKQFSSDLGQRWETQEKGFKRGVKTDAAEARNPDFGQKCWLLYTASWALWSLKDVLWATVRLLETFLQPLQVHPYCFHGLGTPINWT